MSQSQYDNGNGNLP